MPILRPTLLLCSTLLLACGDTKPAGPTAEAKATEAKKQADAADEARAVEARKAKREAEEKAKAEAALKVEGELERLCVVPAKLPKDLVAACEAVGAAQDAFVRRLGDAKAIAEWDASGKERAMPMTIVQCTQADDVRAAACQKNAFDGAGPELKDEAKKIMQVCIDKFGSKRAPPTGMPKKRPG